MVSPLPVWKTVKDSYKLAWKYRTEYLKMTWCWLIIAAIVFFLFSYFIPLAPNMTGCLPIDKKHLQPINPTGGFLNILWDILTSVCCVSVAVAWHRLILCNEHIQTKCYLRFDKIVWNYFIAAIFIVFLEELPVIVSLDLTFLGHAYAEILALIAFILFIGAFPYTIKLSVILPARALNLTEITFNDVINRTRGNFWRIFWGGILSVIPVIFLPIFAIIGFSKLYCQNPAIVALSNMLNNLIVIFIDAPVYLSFLSLSFKHFFEKDI